LGLEVLNLGVLKLEVLNLAKKKWHRLLKFNRKSPILFENFKSWDWDGTETHIFNFRWEWDGTVIENFVNSHH
jgi:hypothetical protein